MSSDVPFHEHLGLEREHVGEGLVRLGLSLGPHHTNKRGIPHGGVVSAMLDAALGGAVVSAIPKAWWCATVSLSVHFIAAARGGRLCAEGRVVRRGASIAFAEGTLRDEAGRIVATAQGAWKLWTRHPDGKDVSPE